MKPELARHTVITLVSNSHFFKGMLFAKDAWGRLGFPDPVKEPEEHKNLVQLMRDLAKGIEDIQEAKVTKEDK